MGRQSGLPANAWHRQLQAGQILLIVILVIITASTVGLSLASRSITSLRTSSEEAESQKALAAAEAGVERSIQGSTLTIGKSTYDIPSNNSNYTTEVVRVESSEFLLNNGNAVPKNEGADVWFVKHDPVTGDSDYSSALSPGFLNLYWGSPKDACGTATASAAIQAIILTRDVAAPNTIKTYRYNYDSCPARQTENNFTKLTPADVGTFTIASVKFENKTPVNGLANGLKDIIFMRVVPLYKDTIIGLNACDLVVGGSCTPLPTQGYVVSSTGTSGPTSKKITFFKGYPQIYLPYISYGLFVAQD